ncbi:hypothetical protein NDU88_000225 [Pleurodeles waltl]|uniref:Secreted protein n=1 Tax=Pleurodeles waltl TaxID=8319 RepID=A0AAV7N7C7_PLEWA|nr:hypothetical protein NDU88_000225 [Pleurodeles waltl]
MLLTTRWALLVVQGQLINLRAHVPHHPLGSSCCTKPAYQPASPRSSPHVGVFLLYKASVSTCEPMLLMIRWGLPGVKGQRINLRAHTPHHPLGSSSCTRPAHQPASRHSSPPAELFLLCKASVSICKPMLLTISWGLPSVKGQCDEPANPRCSWLVS